MDNFVFCNPTRIIFGRDTIPVIGSEADKYGKKALVVYGKGSVKENGILAQVKNSLSEHGIDIIEHPGVKSNPVLSHVEQGIRLAKEAGVDLIIAVGGGSVIDEAKAISCGACVEHHVWKFFTGKRSIKRALPLLTVLTLAASGSEMNAGMVVTNEEKQQKFGFANQHLYPKTSILDPEATFSVPADYTAYGAVDAIAHVLEFYFTAIDPDTPVQNRFMEGLVINIMESCDRVLLNLNDYKARADLMWSATLALNGLTGAGLGKIGFPMHLIEHSLSALYDIPHGAGLSVVIPAWMSWQSEIKPEKFSLFSQRVFGIEPEDKSAAIAGILRLKEWFSQAGSPVTLKELEIPNEKIPEIASNCQALAKVWRMEEYTCQIVENILKRAV
jgi:alcohol dehydrogenase YqhD (iron-dependent ADH family)